MAIKFDALPSEKPYSVIQPDFYYAVIDSAEMKQGKDTTKPPYLNLKYKLKNKDGKNVGVLFDIIAESEHNLMQYKLKRFLTALGISFSGEFELKDLQKVCVGKEFIVNTTIDKQEGRQDRAVVDLFSNEIYYNISAANEVFGEGATGVINASDAEDSEDTIEDDF